MEYLVEAGELSLDPTTVITITIRDDENDTGKRCVEVRPDREESFSSDESEVTSERFSEKYTILAQKVVKQCPNGDTFSGYADAVTGELAYGRRTCARSGEVYDGTFVHGKRHGDGMISRKLDGSKFIGSYRNDHPSKGTIVTSKFTYIGRLLPPPSKLVSMPLFHDTNGTLLKRNGDTYEGGFRFGFYHGFGKEHSSEYTYNGEYQHGKRNGVGTLVMVSAVYEEKKMDCPPSLCNMDTGKRKYTYSGMWEKGMRTGKGCEAIILGSSSYATETFSSYNGTFHQNQRHGEGVETLPDGTILEGIWCCGKPLVTYVSSQENATSCKSPQWRITYPNNDIYHGECTIASGTHEMYQSTRQLEWNDENYFEKLLNEYSSLFIVPHGHGTMSNSETEDLYTGRFLLGNRQLSAID